MRTPRRYSGEEAATNRRVAPRPKLRRENTEIDPEFDDDEDVRRLNNRLRGNRSDLQDLNRDDIETLLPMLDDRQQFVVRGLYGFSAYGEGMRAKQSKVDLGREIGVTGSQVTNIEKKALKQLRRVLISNPYPDDLERHVEESLRKLTAQRLADAKARAARRDWMERFHQKKMFERKQRALWQSWDAYNHRYEATLVERRKAERLAAEASEELSRRKSAGFLEKLFIGRKRHIEEWAVICEARRADLARIDQRLSHYGHCREAAWRAYEDAEPDPRQLDLDMGAE